MLFFNLVPFLNYTLKLTLKFNDSIVLDTNMKYMHKKTSIFSYLNNSILFCLSKNVLVFGLNDPKDKFKDKHLLIDSPRFLFDAFYYHYLNTINIIYGKRTPASSERFILSENQVVADCLNVLLSLPSFSFIWIEVTKLLKNILDSILLATSGSFMNLYNDIFCNFTVFVTVIVSNLNLIVL